MIYPRILLGDLDLTAAPFLWEFGSDFGSGEVVYETLLSMLRDGSSVSSNRVDNRTLSFSVMIEAADFLSLAEYEAQLVAECDRPRNTLTFEPGDAFGPPTVFDTFRAQLTLQRSDTEEQAFVRRWSVSLQAVPWPRSSEVTVTPAQAATPTYTLVDNGSALSGAGFSWAGSDVASVTIDTGKVKVVGNLNSNSMAAWVIRFGNVDLSAVRYVVYDVSSTVPVETVYLAGGGLTMTFSLSATLDLGGGVRRYFFSVPAGAATVSNLQFAVRGVYATGADTYWIDQVQTADAVPFFGTAKQTLTSLIPGGSARTQGSLAVEHASSALGTAVVFTYPSGLGWTPPLRQWRTASDTVTSDSTAVSGSKNTLTGGCVFTIPASILPSGSYLVVARLKSNTATDVIIRFNSYTFLNSVQLGQQSNGVNITFATTGYEVWTLGRMTLPPLTVGPSGFVQVALQREVTDTETVTLDEAWLFHESGDLTMVECGTGSPSAGGPSKRLWLNAPSLDDPQGSVWVGHSADRSDAVSAGALCKARPPFGHNLDPAGMNVFAVTSNADSAAVSSTHYKRWHTHAAS